MEFGVGAINLGGSATEKSNLSALRFDRMGYDGNIDRSAFVIGLFETVEF